VKALFSILLALVAMRVLAVPALTQTNNGVVSWWRFDEGSGDVAMEALAGRYDAILNHHACSKGISGTGLNFDSFTTAIDVAPKDVSGEPARVRLSPNDLNKWLRLSP
jgi:hypothetical protein